MVKRVAFRVDASIQMGTGHVVRCLTLADALGEKGVESVFIQRRQDGDMTEAIRSRGHAVRTLPATTADSDIGDQAGYARWLGVPQAQDAAETREILEAIQPDWLVVDHYALDAIWEATMRPVVGAILVLDDLANRAHDCDVLVDQNAFRDPDLRYAEHLPPQATRLCGPRYALLRPQYAQARQRIQPRRGPVRRVLVFYGGTDAGNETGRALRVLSRPEFAHLSVDLVIGANNPHDERLRQQAAQRPRTSVHAPREHLVDLQSRADLALGAGGTTTWERCALGLPAIVTAIAENQEAFNRHLADEGALDYLGPQNALHDTQLISALQAVIDNPAILSAQAERAWRVTDGLGAARIAEALRPTSRERLTLRTATRRDKLLYFDWANDPITRRNAHNPDAITWPEHSEWFDRKLSDANARLWVLETSAGLPLGQIRVDIRNAAGMISYSVDPAFRRRGLGTLLLQQVALLWHSDHADTPLVGETLAGNEGSRRAFLRAGFAEEPMPDGGYRYRLQSQAVASAAVPDGRIFESGDRE